MDQQECLPIRCTLSERQVLFSLPPPLCVPQVVDDRDGDDGVGGPGLEGEREAVRAHGQQAAVRADPNEVLAEVTSDLK